jgi:hypothetical protein
VLYGLSRTSEAAVEKRRRSGNARRLALAIQRNRSTGIAG